MPACTGWGRPPERSSAFWLLGSAATLSAGSVADGAPLMGRGMPLVGFPTASSEIGTAGGADDATGAAGGLGGSAGATGAAEGAAEGAAGGGWTGGAAGGAGAGAGADVAMVANVVGAGTKVMNPRKPGVVAAGAAGFGSGVFATGGVATGRFKKAGGAFAGSLGGRVEKTGRLAPGGIGVFAGAPAAGVLAGAPATGVLAGVLTGRLGPGVLAAGLGVPWAAPGVDPAAPFPGPRAGLAIGVGAPLGPAAGVLKTGLGVWPWACRLAFRATWP